MSAASYLDTLNAAQRSAVEHGIEAPAAGAAPPLLIIAGAGTGKTNTLSHRVAHLIAHGADPSSILLLTFSRRAAVEMGRRVERILGRMALDEPRFGGVRLEWAGTFHSVGAQLLREFAPRIGLAPGFTIHDREDSADLMNLVRHELGNSTRGNRFPLKGTCLAIYSAVVNTQLSLLDVLRASFPWCAAWEVELRQLFAAYVTAKQRQNVLDYDDLLLYWAHMVADAGLAAELGARFKHILVDEYQDTNRLQAALITGMKPDGAGVTVVGDDAQAIYAFRGATVRNILDFPIAFTPAATVVTLARNYRSTQPVLDAANAVLGQAADHFRKNLVGDRAGTRRPRLVTVRDEADQVACIVEQTLARREEGICLKQQAVLYRTGHHSARLEIELMRRNIPFVKFGGLKFLEAAHVKDVLAVMRWANNPRDRVSGFRALQLLAGIGPKIAARILDTIERAPAGCTLLAEQPVPDAVREDWRSFVAALENGGGNSPWPAAFTQIAQWYLQQLERLHDDAAIRQQDIEQLARIAHTYPSQERFLTELTLDPPEASSDQAGMPLLDEDYLILSTIHSAKGQEWKAVTVLNVVDGCIPSDMSTGDSEQIDEERRLLYVAMTRARDVLDLMVPQRFYVTQQTGMGDRHVYAGRSRFIAAGMLGCFEQQTWPVAAAGVRGDAHSCGKAVDLAAKMRAMWA